MNEYLNYSEIEQCYECSKCGARFGKEEVARAWQYQKGSHNFERIFCMDCGILWESVKERK